MVEWLASILAALLIGMRYTGMALLTAEVALIVKMLAGR